MSIQDVFLFVSTTSQNSAPVIRFIQENRVPVRVVRLDTPEDRLSAANGKHFQIISVPTLLVLYTDSNIQLFVGYDKILAWLQKIVESQTPQSQPELIAPPTTSNLNHKTVLIESEDEEPPKRRTKKLRKTKRLSKKTSGGLYDRGGGRLSNNDDGEEVEIEYIDERRSKNPPPTEGLMVGAQGAASKKGKSRMNDLFSLAKQMERDRKSTLGYDEKDLPVPT